MAKGSVRLSIMHDTCMIDSDSVKATQCSTFALHSWCSTLDM